MQPTPRLKVLSDRITGVLLFVYFCRGYQELWRKGPHVGFT